jgi:hypothetical protein
MTQCYIRHGEGTRTPKVWNVCVSRFIDDNGINRDTLFFPHQPDAASSSLNTQVLQNNNTDCYIQAYFFFPSALSNTCGNGRLSSIPIRRLYIGPFSLYKCLNRCRISH